MYSQWRYCRWCGKHYKGKSWTRRDGFCSAKCKQAHYRAYKKYVTGLSDRRKKPSHSKQKGPAFRNARSNRKEPK